MDNESKYKRLADTMLFFDRKGKSISLDEYASLVAKPEYKIVKQEYIGKFFVSTVWLGLDMGLHNENPPLIFETMVFDRREDDEGWGDVFCERSSNEEVALIIHNDGIEFAKENNRNE
jgi:hypothetical protein